MKHSAKKRIEQEKKAAQRKVTLKWGVVAGIILVIQAVASGFLFLSALNLGMFPLWMLLSIDMSIQVYYNQQHRVDQ